jgi:hypothetical protein
MDASQAQDFEYFLLTLPFLGYLFGNHDFKNPIWLER